MSAVNEFAATAERFCRWIDDSSITPETTRELVAILGAPYAAAAELPREPTVFDVRAAEPPERRAAISARLAGLPIQLYATVPATPIPPEEPTIGDVIDDLTDAYFDVAAGLVLYRSGRIG